jgi:hypothetical protein
MIWVGHVVRMGEKRNACRLFMGKPDREITKKPKTYVGG